MKRIMIIFFCTILITMVGNVYAGKNNCEEAEAKLQNSCQTLKYYQLPKEVKDLMKIAKCDVRTGSSYDYGYTVDLNDDGLREILFCCGEPGHGPCYMSIFGKVKGQWKTLSNNTGFAGYSNDKTSCFGFNVLKTKRDHYHDICQDGRIIEFRNGSYNWQK